MMLPFLIAYAKFFNFNLYMYVAHLLNNVYGFFSMEVSECMKKLMQQFPDHSVISLAHWCSPCRVLPHHHTYLLDLNFLLLDLSQISSIHFNPLSYKSADVDFHLRLLSNGHKILVSDRYVYVQKLITPGNPVDKLDLPSKVMMQPDRLVISLHHDSSSHLNYSGSQLLEAFMLQKSHIHFPSAHNPRNSVLMVDNYINLGPNLHVTLLQAEQLSEAVDVMFGGLVLYLCEGRITSQQLQRLNFISGACLLLITRDCKGLVKEVSRLDLEEKWHFKLRDEFQTACADQHKPLFFLTGKYAS